MEQIETNKYVIFRLGNEDYGIAIEHVQAIERMKSITFVPHMPDHIRGIVDLRGSVTPVVDLRAYMEQKQIEDKQETRILIIQGEDIKTGFVVDRATEVFDIPSEQIQSLSQSGLETNNSSSVAKLEERIIILLDIENLLKEVNPGDTLNQIAENVS